MFYLMKVIISIILGLSKGVGFIRFDQRNEAEKAIKELNGTIPKACTEPITVKFANNPSNNKAFPPLAAYLTPQTAAAARRFAGPIHPTTAGRFRWVNRCRCRCCGAFVCYLERILCAVTIFNFTIFISNCNFFPPPLVIVWLKFIAWLSHFELISFPTFSSFSFLLLITFF